ncbi:hypothetical protein, partial [Sedimentitalea nanhaiensis]|uniref:hypothetical protein n=1 Tax=Sedimentitalea nanhaiensis TaxID=999627 RepID=UPI0020C8D808
RPKACDHRKCPRQIRAKMDASSRMNNTVARGAKLRVVLHQPSDCFRLEYLSFCRILFFGFVKFRTRFVLTQLGKTLIRHKATPPCPRKPEPSAAMYDPSTP